MTCRQPGDAGPNRIGNCLGVILALRVHTSFKFSVAFAEGLVVVGGNACSETDVMGIATLGQIIQVGNDIGGEFGLIGSRATAVRCRSHTIFVGGLSGRARRGDLSEDLDVMFRKFSHLVVFCVEPQGRSQSSQND